MIYRLYVLDLDGTVYRGDEPCPGALEAILRIRNEGALVRFATNNSSRTGSEQAAHLRAMGIEASADEIVTSGAAAARRLLARGVSKSAVAGEQGLIDTLREFGVDARSVREGGSRSLVVGIWRGVDYSGLDAALQVLLGGADFVATNCDPTYPMPGGRFQPGAGAIVAALQAASGRTPEVVGKPQPDLIEAAMESTGVSPEETLVVGDRVDTDLVAGERAGCRTWLVLTGATQVAPPGQAHSADLRGLP